MSNTSLRDGEQYYSVSQYSMKCRIYPNKTQQNKIDNIFHGVQAFCNMLFYDVQTEFMYTKEDIDKKTGKVIHWLRLKDAYKKETIDAYRKKNPIINEVPAGALSSMKKSCLNDVANQYHPIENGVQKRYTVEEVKHSYYSKKNPRTSYCVQENLSKVIKSDNHNVFYFNFAKVGNIKVRGWNQRIRFDDEEKLNFVDFATNNKKQTIFVTVSKDNCGDYWAVFQFSYSVDRKGNQTGFITYVPKKKITENQVGVDVGIKDLAILSDGTKYENKRFKEKSESKSQHYSRKLSNAYGWSNPQFRKDHKIDENVCPSNNYKKWKKKNAILSRDIARKRNDWQNVVSTDIVNNSSFIGIESLDVKGMMDRDRLLDKCGTRKQAARYAKRLGDAALFSFLTKLKYKSGWYNREIVAIGQYKPSSKMCNNCGYISDYMGEEIREWDCPYCGEHHDRDINAAKNILEFALDTKK